MRRFFEAVGTFTHRVIAMAGAMGATLLAPAAGAQTGDFNGDGRADIIVGAPWDDSGANENCGRVNVFFGTATVNGITQGNSDVYLTGHLGHTTQPGSYFGRACAVGDFNGDGFADAAIGAPNYRRVVSGLWKDHAAVFVMFGSAAGLQTGNAMYLPLRYPSATYRGFEYGQTLAAGDFNGDGSDDLAIGAAFAMGGMDGVTMDGAGGVYVYTSSNIGPLSALSYFSHATEGVAGDPQENAHFASSLASGDFNGDGRFDLAIGTPFYDIGNHSAHGLVNVLYGSESGLTATGSQFFRQGNGMQGQLEANDGVGDSLVAGKFRPGGSWDLVIGAPGEAVGGIANAGVIHVILGSASGLRQDGSDLYLNQGDDGLAGGVAEGEYWGSRLAVGRLNLGIYDDLVVASPATRVNSDLYAGIVQIIYSDVDGGLNLADNVILAQGQNGVVGTSGESHMFGISIAASRGSINNDGVGDLFVGIYAQPFEAPDGSTITCGAVHIFRGGTLGVSMTRQVVLHGGSSASVTSADEFDGFAHSIGAR